MASASVAAATRKLSAILMRRFDLASTLTPEAMLVNQLLPIGCRLAIEEASMIEKLGAFLRTSAAMLVLAPLASYAAHAGGMLSERELQLLFPGRFEAVVKGTLTISVTAMSNGSLIAEFLTKADTGQWSIRSGKLCIRFSSWLDGRTRCSPVVEDGGWYRTSEVMFRQSEGLALAIRPARR
jgi:hypothetical protein